LESMGHAMTGVYGKLPSHGDFVRRGLPQSFVTPWDEWLQTVVNAARASLGDEEFAALWDAALGWRFRLSPGACGEAAVAGVLLPSRDSVGRRFPVTLASLAEPNAVPPDESWFAEVERVGQAGRDQGDTVDVLLAALPGAPQNIGSPTGKSSPAGWWTADGRHWELSALPNVMQFRSMLQRPREHAAVRWTASAASHPGTVRTRNEDAFIDRGDIGLWAVADGAGGHESGDIASAAVVAALAAIPADLTAGEVLAQVRLKLGEAHADLQRRAQSKASSSSPGPATTVVVMMVHGDHFACLWAGDSRAYLMRDGTLCQVTRDHSLVQEMVDAGMLAPGEAESHSQANVITRAVGSQDELLLDKVFGRLLPSDVLLLCTDGLFKAVPHSEIARILTTGGRSEELLDQALRASARDNVTLLVLTTATQVVSSRSPRNERNP
jgi:type VI secretion system ImpM family protein